MLGRERTITTHHLLHLLLPRVLAAVAEDDVRETGHWILSSRTARTAPVRWFARAAARGEIAKETTVSHIACRR
jgi:hypothetical protein